MARLSLTAYFNGYYPTRSSLWGRLLFRHGEAERIRILRGWLPSTEGVSILDAGCGDGVCMRTVLSGRPSRIRLEDVSTRAMDEARHMLEGYADEVTCVVADAIEGETARFEIVLGIGVLDYRIDLGQSIERLLMRADRLLLVTVPRRDHPRNWLRYIWLSLHGVDLQIVGYDQMVRLAESLGRPYELKRCRYEWCLRITVDRMA